MLKGKLALGVIGLILLLFVGYIFAYKNSERTVEITVDDKERITQSDGNGGVESKYLIYGEDRVVENTDDLVYFKFNSSEVYNELEEEGTYKVKVAGWRIAFLSWYPNIVEVKNK